jgi:AAA ATPase domain
VVEARTIVMKHNPGFLAAEDLIASFIARQAELESLLEIVRNNSRKSNQHVLVIGRRGMGKTMLVHRLALAIAQDQELSKRWYPLMFGEESYGVTTAGELWLQALHQLAIQTGEARWRQVHVELRREPDDQRLHDLALARLLEFADERGVRLLVTVENLQDVLGVQMSDDDGWTLRHTLLNEPRIMLLATATNRFDDIDKPKAATYEMFRVLQLRPLEREECRVIWARLTGEALEGQMIRPIEIFTGGNPRLLTMLTMLGGSAKGRTLMAVLLGLIDDHSDYFKSNIEALSQEERRAFIALCELWDPSTARAVAEVARFDVNKASMCLGRLVNRGAVEVVQTRGKARYYQVTERLYSLFHRLRQSAGRDSRVVSIVEFMMGFYGNGNGNRDGAELATRHPSDLTSLPQHVESAVLSAFPHGAERAFDVFEALATDPSSLGLMLSMHRDTLIQLAAANPERLYEITSSIPLLEPLTLALAQELGHDMLAPYEVSEIAKDIHAEIRRLRGPVYRVDVPVLAAAEDARPTRAKAATARTSKTKATKKATRSSASKRQGEAGKGKGPSKRV